MVADSSRQMTDRGDDMTAPSDSAARERDANGSCVSPEGQIECQATAGHLAGSIPHGVNQPLTASATPRIHLINGRGKLAPLTEASRAQVLATLLGEAVHHAGAS